MINMMMYLLTNCVFSTVKINYRRVNTFLIILVVWWNINGILICILSTFLILFICWFVDCRWHDDALIFEKIWTRWNSWSLINNSKTVSLFGCAPQHLGVILSSPFALPTNRSRVCGNSPASDSHCCWSFRTPLAGCGAHAGVLS